MRILHIVDGIPPATLGGTGRIVMEIAVRQLRNGESVGILSAADPEMLPKEHQGIRLLTVPRIAKRFIHFSTVFSRSREQEMLQKIKEFSPNIIHAHTISRQCGYRWMKEVKKQDIRLIVTCHDVSHVSYGKVLGNEKNLWLTEMLRYRWAWNPLRTFMIKKYLKNADVILTVSDALKEYLLRRGIPEARTVHNGIDLTYWKPAMSQLEAREQLQLPKDRFLFLIAGRMGFDKGSTLIAATLPENADLIIAGDNVSDEFAPVRNRMHVYKNQNAEQMKLHYSACDAVLVPSRCLDCFPTVCLEAMAMERPVLATSMGGAKEAVLEGDTGWIIDPWNESAWQSRLLWCTEHLPELREMGKRGRSRMESTFSIERMVDLLDTVYEKTSLHV
ncbi:glycosyltransferase family 1 protein [Candidatus Peribacteria bacterium]|nr:glycosyltransferase family 1 protein [Candidatus Peribacteria bacterium]